MNGALHSLQSQIFFFFCHWNHHRNTTVLPYGCIHVWRAHYKLAVQFGIQLLRILAWHQSPYNTFGPPLLRMKSKYLNVESFHGRLQVKCVVPKGT